ncbi:MAG: tRNA 2-thiocytidine(32) synthetase TtcA [Armatimonadetes bacterium]|nr:tRNA 2-thiocytidine(32) synthetase TtcA [Armatimonadota bacterium]
MARRWRTEAERNAFYLSKKVDRAVRDHNMIDDGDRILVGVSGGKDSMSLLRLLAYRQSQSPVKYSLVAAHVKGDARGAGVEVPESFIRWLEGEGVSYHIQDIILPQDEPLPMNCERCGRNRRRTLFEIAQEHGCNKLALGHHLEDFSHTALMNLFQHGRLETMAFRRDYFDGKFVLIRPLAYIREHELVRFARTCEFPIVTGDCPQAPLSRRQSARDLMTQIGREFKSANDNIVRAASASGFDSHSPQD